MPKAHSQPVIVPPEGESLIRRSTLAADKVIDKPADHVNTLYDVLQNSANKYGDKEAIGFRNVEAIIEEEKEVVKVINGEEHKEMKKWKYFQMSPFQYVGYRKMSEIAHDLGAGLAHLGLKKDSKLEIFAATRWEKEMIRLCSVRRFSAVMPSTQRCTLLGFFFFAPVPH